MNITLSDSHILCFPVPPGWLLQHDEFYRTVRIIKGTSSVTFEYNAGGGANGAAMLWYIHRYAKVQRPKYYRKWTSANALLGLAQGWTGFR